MAVGQIFNVATHFKFEIGAALLGASNLQQGVDKLSNSADNALISFQKLGIGAALNLGFGGSSVLGAMGKAIQASEKFRDSQISLSNIISANRDKLIGPVDDFNSRMAVSEQILKRVAADARKFSLPQQPFVETTKLLSAQLVNKGLAGTNFQNAIDLSRNFLKSAPTLGIDAGLAQGQLLRLIEGRGTRGDTLFNRLAGETDAFKQFAGSAEKFNKLKPHKRVEVLINALNQFTSSTDEVSARAGLLTNKLRVVADTFAGLDGILIPIGDVIKGPLLQIIDRFISVADGPLRGVFLNLSIILKPLSEDFEKMYVNLVQLKNAASDFNKTVTAFGLLGLLAVIPKMLILRSAFKFLIVPLTSLSKWIIGILPVAKLFSFVMSGIGFVITRLIPPFLALFTIFQIISRAKAIANLKDLERLPLLMEKITGLFARFQIAIGNIFSPFTEVINAVAEFISPLFQVTFWLERLIGPMDSIVVLFEMLGKTMILARASLEGIFFAIFQFIENIKAGKFLNLTEGVGTAFNAGIDSIIQKNLDNLNGPNGAVSNQVTNIGKVEIRNEFRENLQPDRIAFSVKEQLLKAAQSPTTARGRTFNRGATSGAF